LTFKEPKQYICINEDSKKGKSMKNKLVLTIIMCGVGSTMWARMESTGPENAAYLKCYEIAPTSGMAMDDDDTDIDAPPYGESMPIKRRTPLEEAEEVGYGPEEEYLEGVSVVEPAEESMPEMPGTSMMGEGQEQEVEEVEEETTQYGPEKEDPFIN
jgi:hypothetical protein